jgi:hypothetical protein
MDEHVEPNKSGVPGDRAEGSRAVELMLALGSDASFFRSVDGRFHARVPVNGRHEILGLKSVDFREWLAESYLREHRELPPARSVQRVLGVLEARARSETDRPLVHVRVGCGPANEEPSDYLDLGDSSGRAIKICASGWSVVDRPKVHFRRPAGLLPLPVPSRDGSIELLRPFVNLPKSDFLLLVGWMAAALRSCGPYPILAVHGEQGSAKSTLVKVVRGLIDPQAAPLLAEPRSTRDLMISAANGWLLAFDNMSVVPSWLSDSLCRVATGGGYATRMLFSNDEQNVIYVQRPMILNGIDEFVRRGDLADRSVFLHLPPFQKGTRREEREVWRSFRELQPRILGGLLDGLVGALRKIPSVEIEDLPRMADFARLGEAIGRALGWPAEAFLSAYQGNRKDAGTASIEESVLGRLVLRYVRLGGLVDFTLSPAEMLRTFSEDVLPRDAASIRWPKTPSAFSNEVRRLAPQLREHGLHVTFTRNANGRFITLSRKPPAVDPEVGE